MAKIKTYRVSDMQSVSLALVVFLTLFSVGCITSEKTIGGERDEHGCLNPAGYSWNESVGACIREWELNENQRKAAKIAVEHVGYKIGTTVIKVNVARCPGCFAVDLERYGEQIQVALVNWKVAEEPANENIACDAINPCPQGKECYKFEDEDTPICWSGDPCEKCESKKCAIAESYPMQVFCQ